MASAFGCADSFLNSLPNNQIQKTGALYAYQADTALPASDLERSKAASNRKPLSTRSLTWLAARSA
jgi:hypothetical protein